MADHNYNNPRRRSSSEHRDSPQAANDNAQYAQRNFDFLATDPVPETPPYRRLAASSEHLAEGHGMPPDYRSEYNVSRAHLGSSSEAGASRAHLDEKSDYPREKQDHDHDADDSQYATAKTQRSVHYPDADGRGRLHNISPKAARFPRTESPTTGSFPRPTPSRSSSIALSDVDEDEDEVYDWSDEGDLVDEEAKFSKVMGTNKKKRGFGFIRILTFFFSTLIGSAILSGALVAAGILTRILWLNPKWTEDKAYVADNVEAWLFWAAANVFVSWVLASIIDMIPHIYLFLVNVIWGTVSESLKAKIEMYQTGKKWVKPLFYAAGSWVSWIILFDGVFDLYDQRTESNSRASYTPRVYQVIRFLFFLTLVICVEKLLIQTIAFSFHRTAYQERLDAVAKGTKVLDHLKDYKPKRRGTPSGSGTHTPIWGRSRLVSEPGDMEEGFTGDDETEARPPPAKRTKPGFFAFGKNSGTRGKPKRKDSSIPLQQTQQAHAYPPNASPDASGRQTPASNRQSVASEREAVFVQAAKALKNVALHDARGLRGEQDADGAQGAFTGLNSAHEAKKLARNLYHAFRSDRKRTYLVPADFFPAYAKQEDARDAFRVFDKDDNGDITRAEIKTAILKIYKERRFLARSLRDVSAAVKTLDKIMLIVFLIILIFISLPVFGVSITASFSSIYTLFIGASFIFKNAASNMFDSIMFLFVTHPFDTGDRCFIDNENLIVRKMGLFATTFTRSDGSETYYFNSMLITKFINNARRSANMAENLEMQVDWRTPQHKLDALEKRINDWIDSDEKRWFKPGTSISFSKIDFQRALTLTIGIGHNGTWQDWTLRLARKTAFHAAVQYYCRELNIGCSNSPQPIVFSNSRHPFVESDEVPATPHSAMPHTPLTPDRPELAKTMLGFTPPHGPNHLRARKSNKKKLMGAGEGDAS